MTNQTNKPMCATIAIAALLALSSTPLAAQSADSAAPAPPPIVSPEPILIVPVIPRASPVPVLIIPENLPENAIVGPVVQPLPVPSAVPSASASTAPQTTSVRTTTAPPSSPVASTTRTTARAAPVEPAGPAIATQSEPALLAEDALSVEAAGPVIGKPAPAVAPTPEQARPEQARDVTGMLAVVLLGMLAAAIALVGFLALRRRRPFTAKSEPAITPLARVAPRQAEPVVNEQPLAAATPQVVTPAAFSRPAIAGMLPSEGAAVDLPAEMPATFEARNELLWRMIDARPDKANPFTDRRARLHRARLIMQSLSRTFDREAQIDLSQYPNNWPELARPQYKAA